MGSQKSRKDMHDDERNAFLGFLQKYASFVRFSGRTILRALSVFLYLDRSYHEYSQKVMQGCRADDTRLVYCVKHTYKGGSAFSEKQKIKSNKNLVPIFCVDRCGT